MKTSLSMAVEFYIHVCKIQHPDNIKVYVPYLPLNPGDPHLRSPAKSNVSVRLIVSDDFLSNKRRL